MYTIYLFSIPSNIHILETEYPQGICSNIFVVNDFSKLFLHPSILLIKDLGSA